VCKVDPNNDSFCGCDKDSDCGNLTSGKVCDVGVSDKCMDGCRGTDGNGCPTGYQCTSTDASIGQCVPETGNTGSVDSGDDGSCGCRTPGSDSRTPVGGSLALLLGAGVLVARRRRRR
jgi:MYXO-CTERM domain-containing protein